MAFTEVDYKEVDALGNVTNATTTGPGSWVDGITPDSEGIAVSHAAAVDATLNQLLTLGDSASASAETIVNALLAYEAAPINPITYTPPAWEDIGYTVLQPHSDLNLPKPPNANSAVTRTASNFNDVAAPNVSVATPTYTVPNAPTAPTLDNTGLTLANAPSAYNLNAGVTPTLNLDSFTATTVDAPTLEAITLELPDLIDIQPIDFTIDTSNIDEAINLLEGFNVPTNTLPEYNQKFIELYSVIGSMLNQSFGIIDYILYTQSSSRLERLISRIGDNTDVSAYETWLGSDLTTHHDRRILVSDALEKDTVALSAYQLSTDAELLLFDIALKTRNARFAYLLAQANARAYQSKAIALAYNAKLVVIEGEIVAYNAAVSELRANAEMAIAQSNVVSLAGDSNKLLAREFSVTEGAKKIEADVYATRVRAEAVKLKAYGRELEANAADVTKAQTDALSYTATVEKYIADVQSFKNTYELYAANTDAVIQNNRSKIAEIRADSSKTSGLVAKARSQASQVAVEGIKNLREYLDESSDYKTIANRNAKVEADITKQLADYTQYFTNYTGGMTIASVELDAVTKENQIKGEYIRLALDSASRAAEATQRANESLARSYASAYEAAGRAGASLAAGKMSGFRASASLSASGAFSGSESFNTTYTSTGTNDYQETDLYNQNIAL